MTDQECIDLIAMAPKHAADPIRWASRWIERGDGERLKIEQTAQLERDRAELRRKRQEAAQGYVDGHDQEPAA